MEVYKIEDVEKEGIPQYNYEEVIKEFNINTKKRRDLIDSDNKAPPKNPLKSFVDVPILKKDALSLFSRYYGYSVVGTFVNKFESLESFNSAFISWMIRHDVICINEK